MSRMRRPRDRRRSTKSSGHRRSWSRRARSSRRHSGSRGDCRMRNWSSGRRTSSTRPWARRRSTRRSALCWDTRSAIRDGSTRPRGSRHGAGSSRPRTTSRRRAIAGWCGRGCSPSAARSTKPSRSSRKPWRSSTPPTIWTGRARGHEVRGEVLEAAGRDDDARAAYPVGARPLRAEGERRRRGPRPCSARAHRERVTPSRCSNGPPYRVHCVVTRRRELASTSTW